MSAPPAADTVSDGWFFQASEPPLTEVSVGAVRSRRTVLPAVDGEGVQADALPAPSRVRNSTSVSPSAETVSLPPETAADQLVPPLVDVRYS